MTEITDMVFSEAKEVREDEERESVGAKESGKEEEKNSGGLINNFISNLVAPLSPKVRDISDDSTSPKENNGGIFNSLISGILHHGGGDEREGSAAADEREGGGSGGGGLIDSNSRLPTTPVAGIFLVISSSIFF